MTTTTCCWACESSAAGQPTGIYHDNGEEILTCPDCGETRNEDQGEYHCAEHGDTEIINQLTVSGFTGAPIYLTDLACGCQVVDASADDLGAAE